MPAEQLYVTVIQPDIIWEDKQANLQQYETYIQNIKEKKELVVLPEMFSTGFSMQPELFAEPIDGATVQWMKEMAAKHRCILTGSLMIKEDEHYYNRLLWVQPNGHIGCYDKRHLFGYGDEDKHYSPGKKRLIASINGWRICLMVCYDLRFPVWARNQQDEYDVLLYVANWPERRSLAWKTLLQARAIENMCYSIGVNRVGKDVKEINYTGDSSVFDPLGNIIWQSHDEAKAHTVKLEKSILQEARSNYPFLKDGDKFVII